MDKQALTLDDVAMDMRKVIKERRRIYFSWRMKFIAPSAVIGWMLALALSGFTLGVGHKIVIGAFALVIAYNLVMLTVQLLGTRKAQRALDRGLTRDEVSVSVERFSHIAFEEEYEPWFSGRWLGMYKRIRMYYFTSGAGWREPVCWSHYSWSVYRETSSKGLENATLAGDEFYLITLNADTSVRYIYNTRLFELEQ